MENENNSFIKNNSDNREDNASDIANTSVPSNEQTDSTPATEDINAPAVEADEMPVSAEIPVQNEAAEAVIPQPATNIINPDAAPAYPDAVPAGPGAVPTYPGVAPVYTPDTKPKKKLFKRKSFWAILIVLVAVIAIVAGVASSDSGNSGGSSSSSGYGSYSNPYVNMVKTAKHSTYGITYGAAFNNFFTNPKWSYFMASTGEHVVEFEGGFFYDNAPATATVQFVVDTTEGTLTVYHLSINDVAQSKLMLSALVKKVFESY